MDWEADRVPIAWCPWRFLVGRSYQARNARRGIDAERRAQAELEARGYVTQRAAGSHGPFDVIAMNGDEVLCIQVKSTMKDKSWRPVLNELAAIPRPPFVRVQLWVRVYRRRGWAHVIDVPHQPTPEEEYTDQSDRD